MLVFGSFGHCWALFDMLPNFIDLLGLIFMTSALFDMLASCFDLLGARRP